MAKYKLIEIIETPTGFTSEDVAPVDAWQFGGDEDRPAWLPEISHTVSLPHIGNPDWQPENFSKGAVWASMAYPDSIYVGTVGGWHRCRQGDWVTHEDDGDLRVITAEDFANYRKV